MSNGNSSHETGEKYTNHALIVAVAIFDGKTDYRSFAAKCRSTEFRSRVDRELRKLLAETPGPTKIISGFNECAALDWDSEDVIKVQCPFCYAVFRINRRSAPQTLLCRGCGAKLDESRWYSQTSLPDETKPASRTLEKGSLHPENWEVKELLLTPFRMVFLAFCGAALLAVLLFLGWIPLLLLLFACENADRH